MATSIRIRDRAIGRPLRLTLIREASKTSLHIPQRSTLNALRFPLYEYAIIKKFNGRGDIQLKTKLLKGWLKHA
ncbi:MAG: hypothetical protein K8R79_05695 [Calditrichales bacterium]|nr:hypothetical protein [Calditrichales bacterium]